MENRTRKKSLKTRRGLLSISLTFFSIAFVLLAYAILDFRMGISQYLAANFPANIGILSDGVFLIAVPVFLAILVLQALVLYRILRRVAGSKPAGRRALRAPFGSANIDNAMPIDVECRDPEERGMMVTVN